MSTLEPYLRFAREHPWLFINAPEGGFTVLLDEADIRAVEAQTAQRLAAEGLPAEWATVGVVYQDQYLLLLRDAVRFPDGALGTYVRIVSATPGNPGVAVLPIYRGEVVLIRHFRHATRTWHLEIPRGFGEQGSAPEESAAREMAEEIGATVSHLTPLGSVYPDTGLGAAFVELYIAEIAAYSEPEAREAIAEISVVSVAEFERLIRDNVITDGYTLAAYARAKTQGLF